MLKFEHMTGLFQIIELTWRPNVLSCGAVAVETVK